MQDFFMKMYPQMANLTSAEKEECVPIAIRMIELSKISQINGIVSLPEEVENDHPFLKRAVNIYLDNHYGEDLETILKYYIISNNYAGQELLKCLLIAQGMVYISEMRKLITITNTMGAMLGDSYLDEYISNYRYDIMTAPYKTMEPYVTYCIILFCHNGKSVFHKQSICF